MVNLDEIKTLKELCLYLYGTYNGGRKRSAIKYLYSNGINYKEWLNSKKPLKITNCLQCNKELKKGQVKFCSQSCAATYNNLKREKKKKYCLNCGKELNKSQKKYCDNICKGEKYYNDYIKKWQNGEENGLVGKYSLSYRIRKYLLKKHNYRCEKCGWGEVNEYTKTTPLEIHHIDGDYRNNKEENLQVLCPNCHSLTETYKSHNKNGRKERKKYNN